MSYRMEPQYGGRDSRSTMQSRPMTPGTPGTFDSGLNKYGQYSASNEYVDRYDDPQNPGTSSPQLGGTSYYFKEGGGAAATGTGAAAAATRSSGSAGTGKKNWLRRHPWLTALIALIIVAIAAGAGAGGALAGHKDSNLASNTNSNSDTNGSSGSGSGSKSGSGSGSSSNGTSSNTPAPIVALPKWNMTDPNAKMIGTSLGNWLVLERWLDEDWFTGAAGADSWDEWTFTENLGAAAAKTALQAHWNSWVQESDIDLLKSAGINSIRIPVGYWAFVDSAQGEPYLSKAGQLDQVQKVLGWLYDRKMYALIDLHGMPGSQNGDQASGHNTSDIGWFSDANIGYSYTVLNETIKWIQASNYSSVVHSVCPVNEPKPNGDAGKLATLTSYYETAYTMLKDAGLIMMFHHAFVSDPMNYWASFATGKDPNYLSYNSNPYPGWFPAVSSQSTIIDAVCSYAQASVGYPVPVVMTEYSVVNGVSSSTFDANYYTTQVSAYSWSGGSYFWNFKAELSSTNVATAGANMTQYSLTSLINSGAVAKVDTSKSTLDQVKALPNQQCGGIPSPLYSNPSAQGQSYSSRKRMVRSASRRSN